MQQFQINHLYEKQTDKNSKNHSKQVLKDNQNLHQKHLQFHPKRKKKKRNTSVQKLNLPVIPNKISGLQGNQHTEKLLVKRFPFQKWI